MTDEGGPSMENEEGAEERQGMRPKEAVLPISMMVVLIIVTISLALFVGPIYSDLGLRAVSDEYADNPLIIVYFLGMLLLVSGGILLLRKFLKKRKRRFMRYILAAAVLVSTIYVVNPLVDIAFNGIPPHWEAYEIDIDEYTGAMTINEDDILAYSENEAVYLEWKDGEYETEWKLTGADRLMVFPYFDPSGQPVFPVRFAAQKNDRFIIYHPMVSPGDFEFANISIPIPGSNLTDVVDITGGILLTQWEFEGNRSFHLVDQDSPANFTGISISNNMTGEIGIDSSRSYGNPVVFSGNVIYSSHLDDTSSQLRLLEKYTMEQKILWIKTISGRTLVGCASSLWYIDGPEPVKITDFRVSNPNTAEISTSESGTEILFVSGSYLYSVIIGDGEYSDEGRWYISGPDVVHIDSESPRGEMIIVSEEYVEKGVLDRKERFTTMTNVITLIISIGLVALILFKPKWYLIDLVGILVGAGILSLIGISIPPLLLVILMVLLAVYDFISVYITKHMIALADTVVEAKLPILLVFPKKFSFNYEEKTDLMESKRKGESMFMGLGDVIIPGSLIVSSMLFLPDTGIHQIGSVPGPLAVALFALMGMMASFLGLMTVLVIKGKAHAGLPFLNTGTILGFLIGHFIVYGTFIFF
ncbi:MAG: presenilin family intramembrane aspartyl protease PSH [Thermoplasmatota archaeon]